MGEISTVQDHMVVEVPATSHHILLECIYSVSCVTPWRPLRLIMVSQRALKFFECHSVAELSLLVPPLAVSLHLLAAFLPLHGWAPRNKVDCHWWQFGAALPILEGVWGVYKTLYSFHLLDHLLSPPCSNQFHLWVVLPRHSSQASKYAHLFNFYSHHNSPQWLKWRCHVKSGPGQNQSAQTIFHSHKWSRGKLWQPKLAPPGPVTQNFRMPSANSANCHLVVLPIVKNLNKFLRLHFEVAA